MRNSMTQQKMEAFHNQPAFQPSLKAPEKELSVARTESMKNFDGSFMMNPLNMSMHTQAAGLTGSNTLAQNESFTAMPLNKENLQKLELSCQKFNCAEIFS